MMIVQIIFVQESNFQCKLDDVGGRVVELLFRLHVSSALNVDIMSIQVWTKSSERLNIVESSM